MGGIEGDIDMPGRDDEDDDDDDYEEDDEDGISFTEKRDALIYAWGNCNLDDLADMFVDFVEDEIIGTDRHFN
jgi:hypothetical protein